MKSTRNQLEIQRNPQEINRKIKENNKPTKDKTAKKTIAPCAKLKVADALYINTKPKATKEYIVPAKRPPTTTSKKNNISLPI